jgi:cytochrome c-type biogenesis protein CcmH/NrfF
MNMTTIRSNLFAIAAMGLLVVPVHAQSTGPSHAGFDPNAPMGGHFHEGEIGEKLMLLETNFKCNCSCGLDVHTCQFNMQCGVSPVWTQRIRESLERGETMEVIEANFVAEFGKTVQMAPPMEGFNLFAYFLPVIAIVTAGMLIGLITRGGMSREGLVPVEDPSEDEVTKLREAMKKLDELESPDW